MEGLRRELPKLLLFLAGLSSVALSATASAQESLATQAGVNGSASNSCGSVGTDFATANCPADATHAFGGQAVATIKGGVIETGAGIAGNAFPSFPPPGAEADANGAFSDAIDVLALPSGTQFLQMTATVTGSSADNSAAPDGGTTSFAHGGVAIFKIGDGHVQCATNFIGNGTDACTVIFPVFVGQRFGFSLTGQTVARGSSNIVAAVAATADFRVALTAIEYLDASGAQLPSDGAVLTAVSGAQYPTALPGSTPLPNAKTQLLLPNVGTTVFDFNGFGIKMQYGPNPALANASVTVTPVETSTAGCLAFTGFRCVAFHVVCVEPVGFASCTTEAFSLAAAFTTNAEIINPGLLKTNPTGTTQIFSDMFAVEGGDPVFRGKTTGLNGDYVVVGRGVASTTEAGVFGGFDSPLGPNEARLFREDTTIPVSFPVAAVVDSTRIVSTVQVRFSLVRTAKPNGTAIFQPVSLKRNQAKFDSLTQRYKFSVNTDDLASGTYTLTVYSDSFAVQKTTFRIFDK